MERLRRGRVPRLGTRRRGDGAISLSKLTWSRYDKARGERGSGADVFLLSPRGLAGAAQGLDAGQGLLGAELALEKGGEGLEEGILHKEDLQGQAVALAGEGELQLKVAGHLEEEVLLQHLGLAHLAFNLKEEPAQPGQIVLPLQVFPAFVLQVVEMLGPGQLAEGNDLAHNGTFALTVSLRQAEGNRKGYLSEMTAEDVKLAFDKMGGLIPAIAQDAASGRVLMLAYMNEEAFRLTVATGEAHYFSRSRQSIWHKGGTSGHVQKVRAIYLDCDADAVLLKVEQVGGAACHNGYESCFYRRLTDAGWETEGTPVFDPKEVYKRG